MKKVILTELALLILLAGVMFVLLHKEDPRKDVTEKEVITMVETMAEGVSIAPGGNLRLRRSFGLNAADYDMVVYYMPVETMDVCEFLMIRADESQLDSIQTAMEARVASQLSAFDGYGEKQVELLNKSIIKQYGNYIILIVSETPDEWHAAVKELLEV